MRPKLITPRKLILGLVAVLIATGLFMWQQNGGKLDFIDPVPSTAGKIAFVRGGDLYMADGATGENTIALTNDARGADAEPSWSENGGQLALTSDRNGVVRQLYITNAVPGAKVAVLTNSSTTKEQPEWVPEGDIYFLDGGKIAKLTPKTADTDAIFPTAEQKRKALADLFGAGGISRFAVSPDGKRFYAAVKQEQGEMLIVFVPEENTVAAFGLGEKVLFRMTSTGDVIAVICGGEPFPQPLAIMTPETIQQMNTPGYVPPPLPKYSAGDTSVVVKIDAQFAIQPVTPVPFLPNGIAVSADGTRAAITSDNTEFPGVFVIPLDGTDKGGPVVLQSASEPAFAPDGTHVAYVSGDDVFITKTEPTPTDTPLNLTKGQGKNTNPLWSPAKGK
ncbi:MAG: PD40 domain-containing protein [Akkermansiaceae bacterium]|nr:PD40 domain-containing protein [Armatimonadota bacterium]